MSLTQQLSLKQQLRLTPQQLLLQKLLPLSTLALEERIKNELEDNPALEVDNDEIDIDTKEQTEEKDSTPATIDQDFLQDDGDEDVADYMPEVGEVKHFEIKSELSSLDILQEQIYTLPLTSDEQNIALQIIGSLNHNGYLNRSIQAIIDDLLFKYNKEFIEADIVNVLRQIQTLDPVGIASRNLQECLQIQLKRQQQQGFRVHTALQIVENYFEELSNKHFDKIQQALEVSDTDLETAIEQIEQLNPYPLHEAEPLEKTSIYPDYVITQKEDKIEYYPTKNYIPTLKVSKAYQQTVGHFQSKKEKDAVLFMKQKIEQAHFFVEAIHQHRRTMEEIIKSIIDLQSDYFMTGDEAQLNPMLLKDIAQKTNKDIATISRALQNKYVQTDWGIRPLKYFFNEQISNKQGEYFMSIEIQDVLKKIIDSEDKRNPFTDDALEKELAKRGKKILRRSIANYRDKMNIPPARLRRKV